MRGAVDGYTAPPLAEGPQVIQAGDVVEVRVGEEDGVEMLQAGSEGLGAEIRPCVDQNRRLGRAEQRRGARAPVPGIG